VLGWLSVHRSVGVAVKTQSPAAGALSFHTLSLTPTLMVPVSAVVQVIASKADVALAAARSPT
jgi:hypothetical protein